MYNISIERLEAIERERQETSLNKSYQRWVKSLNVSRLYTSPESRLNAKEMNNQYNFKKNKVVSPDRIPYL
jgi:hypothetical protein